MEGSPIPSPPPSSSAPPAPPAPPASRPAPPTPPAPSARAHIPNILTIARVFLAVAFFGVLSRWYIQFSPLTHGGGPDWVLIIAALLFIIAAATDALDGHLARRWKVVSLFGRVMDPFADKVLVIGAFIFLAGPGFTYGVLVQSGAPDANPLLAGGLSGVYVRYFSVSGVQPWMAAVILGRELLVTSIRGVLEAQGVSFAASWSGKLKMILQCICIPAVLLLLNVPGACDPGARHWTWWVIQFLVGATVLVTAWSGYPYIQRALAAARASRPLA